MPPHRIRPQRPSRNSRRATTSKRNSRRKAGSRRPIPPEAGALLDHAPFGVLIVARNGRIRFGNRWLAATLGYEPEELISLRTSDLLHSADRNSMPTVLRGAGEGERRPLAADLVFIRKDESALRLRCTTCLVRHPGGRRTHRVCFVEPPAGPGGPARSRRDEHTLLRAVIDALPDHIYVKDRDGRYLLVNEVGLRLRGMTRLDEIAGKTVYDVLSRDVAEKMDAEDRRVMETGTALVNRESASPFRGGTGGDREWHLTSKVPLRDARGTVIGVVGLNRDITDRKRVERALALSEQKFRTTFDQANVGITVVSLDSRYMEANDKFCEIVGYTRSELLGMGLLDVNKPEAARDTVEYRRRLISGEAGTYVREKELVRKDGSPIWVALTTSLVRGGDGEPLHFVSVIQDISERKKAEERLERLAHYDALTDLPNRFVFQDRLAHTLAQAKRHGWVAGVMFVDVDRFKNVNDTFSHATGDILLREVGTRLASSIRGEDTVGRLGGDEFGVVLAKLGGPGDAGLVARKVMSAFAAPFDLDGKEIYVTVSIGIALFPADSGDGETLVRNADTAMYRAKENGRNGFQFYMPEMNARARETLVLENGLRRALERGEFALHYQPKMDIASGKIAGIEALLRWKHPERGLLAPAEFLSVLEGSGLVVPVGEWVLRAACAQIAQWRKQGVAPVPVAVNLSARQFMAREIGPSIRSLLEEFDVDSRLFEVEVTESVLMANAEEAVGTLEYLGSMGIRLTVDDFGTGYSSLSYLKRFPFDALKVDRSFVNGVPHDMDDMTIIRAVTSMARSLGLKVIAEGVETKAQVEFLAEHGCDEIQGYYVARPMPADEFLAWQRTAPRAAVQRS